MLFISRKENDGNIDDDDDDGGGVEQRALVWHRYIALWRIVSLGPRYRQRQDYSNTNGRVLKGEGLPAMPLHVGAQKNYRRKWKRESHRFVSGIPLNVYYIIKKTLLSKLSTQATTLSTWGEIMT